MSSNELGAWFVFIGGIYVTLWAYGIVTPSQRERLDSSVVTKLKWLGPVTIVLGFFYILRQASS
jgi:hypothetical protein